MGMAAQSDALGNISENIANSNTIGYKEASTNFLTVLNGLDAGEEFGGGVATTNRYNISGQGALQSTSSSTDLAIQGAGFFVVQNSSGETLLTRAGSFVPDSQGRLVNAAGDYLMGFAGSSGPASASANALNNMTVIQIPNNQLFANASTSGTLSVNLDSSATAIASGSLPSTNSASVQYTSMTSLTAYDNLGTPVTLNVYYANTGPNQWQMTVYNAADASSGGGFPYSAGPIATQSLTFNSTSGALTSGNPATLQLPGGATVNLDVSGSTQLSSAFAVNTATVNGNAPSAISGVQVGTNGALSYSLANGQSVPAYRIGLANVASPTNLTSGNGNVFTANEQSGQISVGTPGTGGLGTVQSSSLESSAVDLSTELSNMIIAQRAFTANSQVFQVASDVLQVLNNLK